MALRKLCVKMIQAGVGPRFPEPYATRPNMTGGGGRTEGSVKQQQTVVSAVSAAPLRGQMLQSNPESPIYDDSSQK